MKAPKLTALAAIAVLFTPVAAFADNQTNVQGSHNSAAGVGYNNVILQNSDQNSDQLQVDVDGSGYYETPDSQLSIQSSENEAAAIGDHNAIIQNSDQDSYQTQVDVEGYYPHGY